MGFIGFPVSSFWVALYFQTELGYSALMTGVHMLPMVVVGLLANLVAALIQHKVSNKLLVGIGACAYLVSFILAAVQRYGDSYWAFFFPYLCICVIGADFQFIVANVCLSSAILFSLLTRHPRCTFFRRCQRTSSQWQDLCFRRWHACVHRWVTALLLPFSITCRGIHQRRGTMLAMRPSPLQRYFGSPPAPPSWGFSSFRYFASLPKVIRGTLEG
jgi:hypothetical protein